MKGWKAIGPDMKCYSINFELGRTYEYAGNLELGAAGFHFCRNLTDAFKYITKRVKIFEVEAGGVIISGCGKSVCSVIKLVREVPYRYLEDDIRGDGDCGDGHGNGYGCGTGYGHGGGGGSGYGKLAPETVGGCRVLTSRGIRVAAADTMKALVVQMAEEIVKHKDEVLKDKMFVNRGT